MTMLDGSDAPAELAPGISIVAPGLIGTADALPPRPAGVVRGVEGATEALDDALASAGMRERAVVTLDVQEIPPRPDQPVLRSARGEDALLLEVESPGEGYNQVVLAADEAGVMTWHMPQNGGAEARPAMRGGAPRQCFLIRRQVVAPPPRGQAAMRGLVTSIGKKILKIMIYPVVREAVGIAAEFLVSAWERRRRPYRVRHFEPESHIRPEAVELDGAAWRNLADGPALLFVHGAFSTAHGGFGALPGSTLAQLQRFYNGRVFAFDHPSMATDAIDNVRWLVEEKLRHLGPEAPLRIDIVSHSRGGLVARLLAGELAELNRGGIEVGRAVLVATPNQGTALVDGEHLGELVDRVTTFLNLLPDGPHSAITEPLEAIIELVKALAEGALARLDGLALMRPESDFLHRLKGSDPGSVTYFAVSANYEPGDEAAGVWVLLRDHAANAVIDRVFGQAANDVVVPSAGAYEGSGNSAFSIPKERRLVFETGPRIWHCNLFSQSKFNEAVLRWLAPAEA